MTDPSLAHRAEQALLGALIARQDEIDDRTAVAVASGLHQQDFADPRHQAIYAALTGEGLDRRGGMAGLGQRLRDMLARLFGRQARELAAYTAGLPACCPDPAHLDSYAGMVGMSSAQRAAQARAAGAAASADARLENAGAWLDTAAAPARSHGHRRPATAPITDATAAARPQTPSSAAATPTAEEGPPAPRTGPLPADIARLARQSRPALQARARQREQSRPPGPDPGEDPLPGARDQARAPARDSLQEQVLVGLIHDPGVAREVTAWLPAAVFSPGVRRGLYTLICTRVESGEPVDPLILAWEAGLRGSAGDRSQLPAPADSETLPAAALRIGELCPDPETTAALGRALYATHLCEHVFGPGWEHTRGPAHLAAAITQPARPAPGPAVRTATAGETALPDPPVPTEPAVRPAPQPAPAASAPAAGPAGQPGSPASHPGPEPATPTTGAPRQPGRAPAGTTPARPAPSAPALPVQAAPPGQGPGAPVPAGPAQRM